ncbi:hypothetical protein V1520DRAFT_376236 [Lipomyces starkeyi]
MRLPVYYSPPHKKRNTTSRPRHGNISFELTVATLIATAPPELSVGGNPTIQSCVKAINVLIFFTGGHFTTTDLRVGLYRKYRIDLFEEPLTEDNCQIDLQYDKICPKSFFGGFTSWKDVPDAIKLRMCEYLESVFPLLQVAYDNWASKIFFAKAFGRKDRNPARALSVNNWKSLSKDRDFIQRARHDDDASIYEDISSRIGSDELADLYTEQSRPSLCHETSYRSPSGERSLAVSDNEECEDNNEQTTIEIVHNLEIEKAKEVDYQRRLESAKRRRQAKEMVVKMSRRNDLSSD